LSGVISADITDGDTSNFEYLDKVDYLFLSKKDLNISIDELVSKVKGWVIIHDVNGSHSTNGKESFDVNIDEVITNINVLGAGDYFASSFICHRLKEFEVKESIKFSHNNVSRILKIRNNVL
jgi:sugar/nucleoside kinase (ribokinase family)